MDCIPNNYCVRDAESRMKQDDAANNRRFHVVWLEAFTDVLVRLRYFPVCLPSLYRLLVWMDPRLLQAPTYGEIFLNGTRSVTGRLDYQWYS
jgi:hypothetical protein